MQIQLELAKDLSLREVEVLQELELRNTNARRLVDEAAQVRENIQVSDAFNMKERKFTFLHRMLHENARAFRRQHKRFK